MAEKIKVLVVDDTSLFRRSISAILSEDPGIEVVGTAPNGKIALKKVELLKPEVITMDIEMPEMDGITALKEIKKLYPDISVIMFSVHTERGAEKTIEALSLGAADFVTKPRGQGSVEENIKKVRTELLARIRNCRISGVTQKTVRPTVRRKIKIKPMIMARDLVAIGSSTGGPNALAEVIPKIPANIKAGILIVQHMPPVFTCKLAEHLDAISKIEVREAEEGDLITPGVALIAPGGYHMVVKKNAAQKLIVSLNQDSPENHCRPSVDVLFRSVAEHYKSKAIGIILTGMGQDGFEGVKVMKEHGAPIIAQDKASCVVWGMPRFIVEAELEDSEVDIKRVADEIGEYMF